MSESKSGRNCRRTKQPATHTGYLRLQSWFSPAFPTGSFSYSHGLETLVAQGRVSTTAELGDWLKGVFHYGSGWNDALLLCEAWRAADAGDTKRLSEVNDLALAMLPSKERYLETSAQGNAFNRAVINWDKATGTPLEREDIALPVAVGWHCGKYNILLDPALNAHANAFLSNLVWIAVRIIPLGQSEGLQQIAAMEENIVELCNKAQNATLDDLGSISIANDISSMQHETLKTRIFRS